MAAPQAEAQEEWTQRTLYVANNAVDSATCGSSQRPCRSLSRAIANAHDGDRILVGPGRYGDLNGDGDFSDPGEEAAEVGSGCRCMVLINKRLRIESTDGADATVLDAAGARLDVVNITASRVVFGGDGKGFTLTGARKTGDDDGIGLQVLPGTRDVEVTDNVADDDRDFGFFIQGDHHTIRDNRSHQNGHGFLLEFTTEGHVVTGNVATSNGTDEDFGHGFIIGLGNGYTIMSNRAIGNDGVGFLLSSAGGTGFVFTQNDAIGNRGTGTWVLTSQAPSLALRGNDIFGNLGEAVGGFFPPFPNCGLVNDSGHPVDATRTFWGAPTGPGPDPADDAGPGSICDRNGTTVVVPFRTWPGLSDAAPSAPTGDGARDAGR
ncbi:right-handed parallel beta-helix repeat-containing protein [Pyxidicoccus parkwayensis]|uniref:Right-handed parallel beta-helix repeat-containing protein n=1 Tax=Pyxidicoccus parkwayensis TaxID=2813578 RepID=A0ABX7P3S8_9BACT|nr:NosD domain-containing protein [Pyxidicoccus parkwaysis]QSQ25124.1 right-handed parallel beta-helix repeat-containing protein [Pyxidicoccus parkwaysis]